MFEQRTAEHAYRCEYGMESRTTHRAVHPRSHGHSILRPDDAEVRAIMLLIIAWILNVRSDIRADG